MKDPCLSHWMNRIENYSITEINEEIFKIEKDDLLPYVEKELKLGCLYYAKDYIGTATNIFSNLTITISKQKTNFDFIKENKKGLNILQMGFKIVPDGCGGFEVFETGGYCGPICGCIGIVAVMAICGISADQVCSFDSSTGESGGCIGNCLGWCCNGCACLCGSDTKYT